MAKHPFTCAHGHQELHRLSHQPHIVQHPRRAVHTARYVPTAMSSLRPALQGCPAAPQPCPGGVNRHTLAASSKCTRALRLRSEPVNAAEDRFLARYRARDDAPAETDTVAAQEQSDNAAGSNGSDRYQDNMAASIMKQETITVAQGFQAEEGQPLGDLLLVGPHLGSGSTADVYKLQYADSKKTAPLVLKMAKSTPGVQQAFEREWMLGRRLNVVAERSPAVNLLIHTGPGVVSRSDADGALVFRGCLLEAVQGKSLDKRLEGDKGFCDIDYLLTLLQQVLAALAAASLLVKFNHGDMRISNIMEHVTDQDKYNHLCSLSSQQLEEQGFESAESAALSQGAMTFRIIDFGHSSISEERSAAMLAADGKHKHKKHPGLALKRLPSPKGLLEWLYRFLYGGKSDTWRLLRSLAPRLDGRSWPQRRQGDVLALYRFLGDVLDLQLEARFFEDRVAGQDGGLHRAGSNSKVFEQSAQDFVEVKELPSLYVTSTPRRFKLFNWIRERLLRLWSRLFSHKPRISAAEALQQMERMGLKGLTAQGSG